MLNINLDFNELSFENIADWPIGIKIFCVLFIFIFVLFLGYWFDIRQQIGVVEAEEAQEVNLKNLFESKHNKVVNLSAYREQIQSIMTSFGELLRQLPEKTEVPGLLEDISHQGLLAGLVFKAIRLQPEKEMDFYVELPIEISVIGSYHQLAQFISNIAALPRIVTLHNFVIKQVSSSDCSAECLMMNVTAKTYRYLSTGEGYGLQETG